MPVPKPMTAVFLIRAIKIAETLRVLRPGAKGAKEDIQPDAGGDGHVEGLDWAVEGDGGPLIAGRGHRRGQAVGLVADHQRHRATGATRATGRPAGATRRP